MFYTSAGRLIILFLAYNVDMLKNNDAPLLELYKDKQRAVVRADMAIGFSWVLSACGYFW